MTMDTSELCRIGARLADRYNNVVVTTSGDCTPLYWHITECEECSRLQDSRLQEKRIEDLTKRTRDMT